jgi:hypothetical protein
MIVVAFACLLIPVLSFAQSTIKGKVLDDKGIPLGSVSVFIKNTTKVLKQMRRDLSA